MFFSKQRKLMMHTIKNIPFFHDGREEREREKTKKK